MTDEQFNAQLRQRLIAQEDHFVERKLAGVSNGELRQTIGAFANSVDADAFAVLFIGVHDKTGEILGVPAIETDRLQMKIQDICKDCYPEVTTVTSQVLPVDDKLVVAVLVRASSNRPHFTGPAYVRRGSQSMKASAEQFDEMIASRNSKTGSILRMRDRPITVHCIGRKLLDSRPVETRYLEEHEHCFVVTCDAQSVRLKLVSSEHVSVPLDSVSISRDEKRWCPLLVIKS